MHYAERTNNQYYNFIIHCYYTLQEMKYSLTRVGSAVILCQKTNQKCKIVSSQGGPNANIYFLKYPRLLCHTNSGN